MNIFFLDQNPKTCAEWHVNKHVISQIKESAQLLSTAHRYLDGQLSVCVSETGRKQKKYILSDDREHFLYSATHINHPSAIWARSSLSNYMWLSHMLVELCKEYTHRYGKIHKCEQIGLVDMLLNTVPKNISNNEFTEPTPAMPDHYKVSGNSIQSYHNYYNGDKRRMFNWKNREVPYFINGDL